MKFAVGGCFILLLFACSMQRTIDSDIDTLVKYAPNAFPEKNTDELKATSHRGYGIYKATCTGSHCHGSSNRGTDTIPHFSLLQLDSYNTAAKKSDPKNHAVTAKLSPEQLSDVMSFLFLRTLSQQVAAKQKEGKAAAK